MSLVTYWRTRTLLASGGILACVLAATAFAAMGLPAAGSLSPSLFTQPSPVLSIVLVAVLLVVSAGLGTAIGGRIRPDSGMLAAACALVAVSWSTGSVRHLIFTLPPGSSPMALMAMEAAVLMGLMGAVQWGLIYLVRLGYVKDDGHRDGVASPAARTGELALAGLCTAAVFVLLAFFFLPTDAKKQAIFGVGFAAALATIVVHFFVVPQAPSWPFWAGVMAGGIAAYGYAQFTSVSSGPIAMGWVELAPARAAPLDLAGSGVAGSLIGYWYSRKWKRPQPETEGA